MHRLIKATCAIAAEGIGNARAVNQERQTRRNLPLTGSVNSVNIRLDIAN